jgi:hypothetical protein
MAAERLIGTINEWSENRDMEGGAREKLRQLYVYSRSSPSELRLIGLGFDSTTFLLTLD